MFITPIYKNDPKLMRQLLESKNLCNNELEKALRTYYSTSKKKSSHIIKGNIHAENFMVTKSPEAYGVNITDLMTKIGVSLKWNWPPEHNLENDGFLNNTSYIVSLAGTPKK